MSLVVWLPLTKDLRQQGLDNTTITATNGIFIDGGKLGKCLKLGYTNDFSLSSMVNGKQISVAYWVKINTATSTQWLDPIHWYTTDGSTNAVTRQEFYSNCTLTGFWYQGGSIAGVGVTVGEWIHFVITVDYNTGKVFFYKNGVQVGAQTNASTSHKITGANFRIGENGLDLSYNDVRIYDHCLSPMEVKELAKGLVLHYPLNRQGWGQENLLVDTQKELGQSRTTYNIADYNFSESLVSGDTYTITAKVNTSSEKTFVGFYHSGGSYSMSGWLPITANGYYQKTFTANSNMASQTSGAGYGYCRVYVSNNPAGTQGSYTLAGTANVEWIKIEKGSIATPWCPNSSDALATTMGLNSTTEYDYSGFCNNGTRTGTFIWTSDTPKYAVSTHIGTTSSKIHISNFPTSGFGNSYSFTWWGKRSSNSPMFWGFSDGIRLNGMYSGTLWNTGDSSNNPIYKPGTTTTITAPSVNVWHHYVMTGDGTTCKLYVDGVLYGQAKTYKAISGTSIYINGWNSDTTYCSDNTDISDFRIYATALSADDVKSLYQNCATIDPDGTIRGQIRS